MLMMVDYSDSHGSLEGRMEEDLREDDLLPVPIQRSNTLVRYFHHWRSMLVCAAPLGRSGI